MRVGSDLEVRLNGASDKLVLQSWYSGSAFHVEEFRFTDGSVMTDSQAQGLVSAMAAFAPDSAALGAEPGGKQHAAWVGQLAVGSGLA